MPLRISEMDKTEPQISLKRVSDGVEVWIDGDYIAMFNDDGGFVFHGVKGGNRYKGRWDE